MNRAYSLLHVKAIDADKRVITGVATTPELDRVGDIIDPLGVKFKNPLPLLLFHDVERPVGTVRFDKATKDGITFEAKLADVSGPASLLERIEEAWESVKAGLVKGVSIGFRPDGDWTDVVEPIPGGGWRFKRTEVVELSLVTIPANAQAIISNIKSFDAPHLALSGTEAAPSFTKPKAAVVAVTAKGRPAMSGNPKPIADRIKDFEATRETKRARMAEIMGGAEGQTLDQSQAEEYDTLETEIKSLNDHIQRLQRLEELNVATAVAVAGKSLADATQNRGGGHVTVADPKLEPGQAFARYVMAKMRSYREHVPVAEIVKQQWPSHTALHAYAQKAAVPAGTSVQTVWAAPLVDQTNLASEFIEFLRPRTIIGRIPGLRRVPFNIRVIGQTGGGDAYWVGEGAPKPLTSFAFNATTLGYTKVAAIAVITEELARFSSPSAELLVRDSLAAAVIERIDVDFIDPLNAGTANVKPASITNGVTPLSSAGTSADNVRTDLMRILAAYADANQNTTGLVIIMPSSLTLGLMTMTNALGQAEFPNVTTEGGNLRGLTIVASQYAANSSGAGNLVIALNAPEIFLADDGGVDIDVSREASLQMLDNPTNNSATATPTTMVSMWQTNSLAIRAERFINWAKRRATAVVYMDDVNWGSVGSP